jgi:hypothetical protein
MGGSHVTAASSIFGRHPGVRTPGIMPDIDVLPETMSGVHGLGKAGTSQPVAPSVVKLSLLLQPAGMTGHWQWACSRAAPAQARLGHAFHRTWHGWLVCHARLVLRTRNKKRTSRAFSKLFFVMCKVATDGRVNGAGLLWVMA